MSNARATAKPFVPGSHEGRAPELSGRVVTLPMVVATTATMIFAAWAFDSLRWWIAVVWSMVAVAVTLFVTIYFGKRAIHKYFDGEKKEAKQTPVNRQP
jgi:cobalamin biosynthesis protein CobD/CbiB